MDGQRRKEANSSPSTDRLTPQSDSGSDLEADDFLAGEDTERAYELKKLTGSAREGSPQWKEHEHEDEEDELWKDGAEDEDQFVDTRHPRRASASTTQSYMLYTPDEERTVVRRLDRRVVLLMALLYMLSFLDRSLFSTDFVRFSAKDSSLLRISTISATCLGASLTFSLPINSMT